jgi:hypothetical protein
MKIHLDKVEPLVGFSTEHVKAGERKNVGALVRSRLTSDDPNFHKYMEGITGSLLSKAKILPNQVHQILILVHEDLSADFFINDFPVAVRLRTRRSVKAGQMVSTSQIADITHLEFPDIEVKPTDAVVYCFHVKWKFGLYFDFQHVVDNAYSLDVDGMQRSLGGLFRYLEFQDVYLALENKERFEALITDGWFPFIELLGQDFKEISDAYESKLNVQARVDSVVGRFTKERVEEFTSKWWSNPLFDAKKPLLEAGIQGFLTKTQAGNIQCIKTLLTEIEGLIRLDHFKNKATDAKSSPLFLQHLGQQGLNQTARDSLFFPEEFVRYLKEGVFPKFDLPAGNLGISRHTTGHGLAKAEDYTQARALQTLLILDQVYFYLSPGGSAT